MPPQLVLDLHFGFCLGDWAFAVVIFFITLFAWQNVLSILGSHGKMVLNCLCLLIIKFKVDQINVFYMVFYFIIGDILMHEL